MILYDKNDYTFQINFDTASVSIADTEQWVNIPAKIFQDMLNEYNNFIASGTVPKQLHSSSKES